MLQLGWLWSDPLKVGSPAPAFKLKDQHGNLVDLKAQRGKNVILIFYPADDTPGCTKQVCDIRDNWSALQSKNTVAFAINPGNETSHKQFADKYSVAFPLLVDGGQQVARLYNANGLFVKRTVYLIDPDGVIRFGMRGSPSAQEVLTHAR